MTSKRSERSELLERGEDPHGSSIGWFYIIVKEKKIKVKNYLYKKRT
jgi:hypothetical protein